MIEKFSYFLDFSADFLTSKGDDADDAMLLDIFDFAVSLPYRKLNNCEMRPNPPGNCLLKN